jgi:formate dehydrogenase iron-sulfur subunit
MKRKQLLKMKLLLPRASMPRDAAALAVGADAVAQALQRECEARGLAVELVRGSRGLLWLETLVEVETAQGRVAYGPVQAADVPGLLTPACCRASPMRYAMG